MPAIVLIAIIGLIGGVLSGLFGIGGGLVIVPARVTSMTSSVLILLLASL
jgi:uncharacterized membrane protein YfcA